MSAVIADACFLITFGNAGALGVVMSLRAHRVLVSARSLAEVTKPPARTALDTALASGAIAVESINVEDPAEQGALARFDARIAFRNRGDAEVLALTVSRGYIVASDDRAVRSAAIAEVGATRLAGTVDFLKWAVSEGRLDKPGAIALLGTLDVGAGIMRQVAARGQVLDDLL